MNTFLVLASLIIAAFAEDVSLTQGPLGTYKYIVNSKDNIRTEERLADGTILGQYTIPDANGHPMIVKYSAGKDGFRILEGLEQLALTKTASPVVDNSLNLQVPSTVVNTNFLRTP